MNTESFHERIEALIKAYAHGKNTEFAKLIDDNEANIRGYRSGKILPKINILQKIVKTFDISAEWLLTGEGEMLKSNSNQVAPPVPSTSSDINLQVMREQLAIKDEQIFKLLSILESKKD